MSGVYVEYYPSMALPNDINRRCALSELGERSRIMNELPNNMLANHGINQNRITAKGDGERKSHQSQNQIPILRQNLDNQALLQEQMTA
jgi:hypothetical protein